MNFNLMPGFVPAAEVLLFRQKDPKPGLQYTALRVPCDARQIRPSRNSLRSNRARRFSEFACASRQRISRVLRTKT